MIMLRSRNRRLPEIAFVIIFSVFLLFFFTVQTSQDQRGHKRKIAQSLSHEVINEPLPPVEVKIQDGAEEPIANIPVSADFEQLQQLAPTSFSLPSEYLQPSSQGSGWCRDRFEIPYLTNLSKTQAEYCDSSSSTSTLRCFSSPTGAKGSADSFCIGGPSLFDLQERQFKLDCQLRKENAEELKRAPALERFPSSEYSTKPHSLMRQYVGMDAAAEHMSELAKFPRKFTILIRREQPITDIWHELVEISSMSWTLDVLRMTMDKATGKPFFSLDDVENTRVLILDEQDDGPYFSLWTLFAKRPITRLSKVSENDFRDPEYIVLPLSGDNNPMWQDDWELHSCSHSALLNVFSNRVLDFYGAGLGIKEDNSPLVLTFIDQHEKQQLVDKAEYVKELKQAYPSVEIQMIDFASIPFAEQLNVVRHTDILVGMHGAELTHALFLPPGSAVVEILPADSNRKGFRNLAKLLGHRYFSTHMASNGTQASPPADNFSFNKNRFMKLVNVAVTSMYNRGLHNEDVV